MKVNRCAYHVQKTCHIMSHNETTIDSECKVNIFKVFFFNSGLWSCLSPLEYIRDSVRNTKGSCCWSNIDVQGTVPCNYPCACTTSACKYPSALLVVYGMTSDHCHWCGPLLPLNPLIQLAITLMLTFVRNFRSAVHVDSCVLTC